MSKIVVLGAGMLSLALATAAHAQSTPLIIDQNRADRQIENLAPAKLLPPAPSTASIEQQGSNVPLRGVWIEGSQIPTAVVNATKSFIGKPANKATLQALAAAITDTFAKQNIALYTVVIPNQDLSDGRLTVQVAQGFISGVAITGDVEGRKLDLIKAYALKLTQQKPLMRPTLERYLSLIRDMPGLTVDAKLLKGGEPGAVKLVLDIKQKQFDLATSFNNHGSGVLGNGQFQAIATANGLLREGDQTALTLAAAQDFKQYRYVGLLHSTPIGSEGLRLAVNGGYIDTRPKRTQIRGDARTAGLQVSMPLIRGYTRNLIVSGGIDGLNSDNAILGTVFSSERTRALRFSAAFSDSKPRRAVSGSVSVSKGIDMLGARANPLLSNTEFAKLNVRAGLDQAIGKSFVARVRGTAQFSRNRLPGAERFTIGGIEFGRAFESALLSGDHGYAGSTEIAWRAISKGIPKLIQGSELYGFVDEGKVTLVQRGLFPTTSFDLASAGGGVRAQITPKAMIELEAARGIDEPYPGYGKDWRLFVTWRLALKK